MVVNTADNRWATSNFIVAPTIAEGASYTTIASALSAASSGNTIFIKPGTYTEDLTLKAGVNLVAFNGDQSTPNVTIVGKATATFAGTCSISNIRLQTNSDFCLVVSGASNTIVILDDCHLNCTNNTGISYTSSGASSAISLRNCVTDLTTTGIALYASSGAGAIGFVKCSMNNSGSSLTNSTASSGIISLQHTSSSISYAVSGTGVFNASFTIINQSPFNNTAITTSGTSSGTITNGFISSGTASAISIGAGTSLGVTDCTIVSSNTNPITGAGTITMGGLTFGGTSSNVNVTTQSIKSEGPSRTIGSANTGATNTFTITNSSNTASSNALENISVGGTSAGDPFTTYTVSGTTNWSHGIDNSVTGDPYVIAASTALGTTNVMSATTAGEVNWPLQPAFLATHSVAQGNATGAGTTVTVNFTTEVFDQNNDYDGTNTFTAPVTGKYRFHASVLVGGVTSAMTAGNLVIVTSNRNYAAWGFSYGAVMNSGAFVAPSFSVLADMDVGDTCTITLTISNGAGNTADLTANVELSNFSGQLEV